MGRACEASMLTFTAWAVAIYLTVVVAVMFAVLLSF